MDKHIYYLMDRMEEVAQRRDIRYEDDIEDLRRALEKEVEASQHPLSFLLWFAVFALVYGSSVPLLEDAYPPWLKTAADFGFLFLGITAGYYAATALNSWHQAKIRRQLSGWLKRD